jgi:flagellar biosynthetic protein FlhB
MAEELGERTELPTGRRLSEARNRGQVAKSQDLGSALDLTGAVLLIVAGGGAAIAGLAGLVRRVLQGQVPGDPLNPGALDALLMWTLVEAAKIIAPALLIMLAVGLVGNISQIGWHITTDPLHPKIERLNPWAGLKKLFNPRSLMKTGMNSVKLFVVATVAALLIRKDLPMIAALPGLGVAQGLYKTALIGGELVAWLLVIFLALGLADFAYQRWRHTRDLMMTRQEVKEERRDVDGDPEVKSRRLRMARDIAMQRIRQDVPRADVIVTNPTHFSVAIKYDPDTMRAPRIVAKGADDLAYRIREVAIANGVPIVERAPLARALFWGVDVGHEIKPQFYEAVAEVLAYVYRLKGVAA